MAAFLNLLSKIKPAKPTSFIGEHLIQLVGWSMVPGWLAQHICMSGVYSPIYLSSKWQLGSVYLCQTTFKSTIIHQDLTQLVLHIGPRLSCQNKKCTCVNNRCIRSKISGDNLDYWRVKLSVNCEAHKK